MQFCRVAQLIHEQEFSLELWSRRRSCRMALQLCVGAVEEK